MSGMVKIAHRDGREYAVLPADFEKGAEGDYHGFRITGYESGEKYEGPKTAAAVAKAQDAPGGDEAATGAPKGGK